MTSRDDTDARPVIRDRRRIDPVTGNVREPAQSDSTDDTAAARGQEPHAPGHAVTAADAATAARLAELTTQLADLGAQLKERTADLQRVQAEYANYRKRVERDRVAVREQALANVIVELLPILDDIGRAREHGELSGGFKSVAESIEAAAAKLGLVRYGEHGEPFDPNVHEALMHSYSSEVTEPTCVQILQPGYKVGGRILRPARVAVAEPGVEQGEEPSGTPQGQRHGPAQQEPETPQDRGS